MTRNQIELAKHLENVRANKAQELETNRANLKNEQLKSEANQINRDIASETARANQAREAENYRINTINSSENHRSNLANEQINRDKNSENYRHNVVNEYEQYRHNVNTEQISDYNAITDRYQMALSLGTKPSVTTSILAGLAGEHAYEPAQHFTTNSEGVLIPPVDVNVIKKDVRPGITMMSALENKYTAQVQTTPIRKGNNIHEAETISSTKQGRSVSKHTVAQQQETKGRAQLYQSQGTERKSLRRAQ